MLSERVYSRETNTEPENDGRQNGFISSSRGRVPFSVPAVDFLGVVPRLRVVFAPLLPFVAPEKKQALQSPAESVCLLEMKNLGQAEVPICNRWVELARVFFFLLFEVGVQLGIPEN